MIMPVITPVLIGSKPFSLLDKATVANVSASFNEVSSVL